MKRSISIVRLFSIGVGAGIGISATGDIGAGDLVAVGCVIGSSCRLGIVFIGAALKDRVGARISDGSGCASSFTVVLGGGALYGLLRASCSAAFSSSSRISKNWFSPTS